LCKACRLPFFFLLVFAEWETKFLYFKKRSCFSAEKVIIITKNSLSFAKNSGMDWTEQEEIW
jgi:hypothetical protein